MSGRLAGRRALVTGASRGIGAAIAERLAAEGADVAIVARTLDHHAVLEGSLEETAATMKAHGVATAVIVANLADDGDRARIVPEAERGLGGPIDILVNNAAAGIFEHLETVALKRRRLSFEVNVHAPVDLSQAVIPGMRAKGEGWIVNLTSGAARHHDGPPFDQHSIVSISGVYGASKAALNKFTNALGAELYGTGVRVNAIEPHSTVRTAGAVSFVGDKVEDYGGALPGGEFEEMDTLVDAVIALCDCPPERTGRIHVSTDLLAELGKG
jgi:NAD(P)-dependent dehydrogenase (short-subunit alcohol dehydrogenase family)